MIIQPIADNIIIKLPKQDKENKTASGILIVTTNQNAYKPDRGQVIAVGEGRRTVNGDIIKSSLKEGDEIIFNKFAGTEIIDNEEKYLIIKENDVLAIIK